VKKKKSNFKKYVDQGQRNLRLDLAMIFLAWINFFLNLGSYYESPESPFSFEV